MKRKAYLKNQIRIIFKTKARFLSIFIIVFLGASFFAGLRHAPMIMKHSINQYIDTYQFNDLDYIATLGFSKEDVDSIKDNNSIDKIEAGMRFDALIEKENMGQGVTVYTRDTFSNDINAVEIVDGRLPTKDDECIIDYQMNKRYGYALNDTFVLKNNQGQKEYTIVGLVNDPRYISDIDRGSNSLGDGSNIGFVQLLTKGNETLALPKELYTIRQETILYNEIRITLKQNSNDTVFSDSYSDFIEEKDKEIKDILISRYDALNQALTNMKNGQQGTIVEGKIISLTSNENIGIMGFESNCDAITSLSLLFPLLFFSVAALVSLTTMTRMVEEQRVQSGTLRALGYSKKDIIMQHIVYAFLATFIASVLGIIFGVYFFPSIIYFLYSSMMYDIGAPICILFDTVICLQTVLISVAVTLVVTWLVCYQELSLMPSSLLRPKAPKAGKRILLERISFVWKRLSFNYKVTMRNIFRYKKRFFMSIIGVAGCTALIVVGFGLKQSVSSVADRQYGEVWKYDGTIGYQELFNEQQMQDNENDLQQRQEIENVTSYFSGAITFVKDNKEYQGNLEIPRDVSSFEKMIHLNSFTKQKTLHVNEEGVMISAKISELLDVQVGDLLTVTISEKDYRVKVAGIFELYFTHYMYMSKSYYESITGETILYNGTYFTMNGDQQDNQKSLEEYIDNTDLFSSVSYVDGISEGFRNQMASIDGVVAILIVCAGALAFVVLYNLTNINIQERKSEIATIKVLGFYPKEIYQYVFRENLFLAFIGSIIGLFLGKAVHMYLIKTVEIEMTMFVRELFLPSYIIAIILTMIFAILINQVMKRVLKTIDMVESLKSIE